MRFCTKSLLVVAAVALLAGSGVMLADAGDFATAAHNFSTGTNQGCVACHVAHNASTASGAGLLWNKDMAPELLVDADITKYAGAGTLTPQTLLCLSCHDGGSVQDHEAAGANVVGVDLSDDHPVGVTYDEGATGFKVTALPLFGAGTDTVSCASCHDVHGTGNSKLLRIDIASSAICLDCHDK